MIICFQQKLTVNSDYLKTQVYKKEERNAGNVQ